jgi:radical SAM superfamily enzyme YgiQ (UPF0313 family)
VSRRIALLQLPVPDGPGSDVPLAAACLRNAWRRWLAARGIEAGSDKDPWCFVEPPEGLANRGSDPAILDWLAAEAPDVLGFSLYLWNRERSAWLAAEAKARLPDLRCLAGGPEVQDSRLPATDSPAGLPARLAPDSGLMVFDWLVAGPGEAAFVALLARLTGMPAPAEPPAESLFLSRRAAEAVPADAPPRPHPWTDGGLPLGPGRAVHLETVRGCPNKCSYCHYGKQFAQLGFLPEHEASAVIRHAIEAGADELYLMDPSFSQRPRLDEFLGRLAAWNAGRLAIHTELRLEDITPQRARLLREAGVRSVEAGLQSTNPRALAAVGRGWDQQRFERGADCLQREGIRISTGVIAGLPEDGLAEIAATIDYVAGLGLGEGAEAYPLAVLPGTELRRQAAGLGLEYLDRPPYYLLSSPWIDQAGMQEALDYAAERWDRDGLAPVAPSPASARRIRSAPEAAELLAHPARLPLVLDLRLSAGLLADPGSLAALADAGRRWRQGSPSSELRLLVDLDRLPREAELETLRAAFLAPGHLMERLRYYHPDAQGTWSCRIFAMLADPDRLSGWLAAGLDGSADLVVDLAGAAAGKRHALARLLLETDWEQMPFVRTGPEPEPAIKELYGGLENLLLA